MTTNLSGSLTEFSLAEVLSLLGMGGRTARMQVSTPGSAGMVHLVDGEVSAATADSARAGLLRALVAGLPVPADDLAQAVHEAEPVRALVDSGVLDRDAVLQVAAEQCTEAVGEMLTWTEGEFAVWVGVEDPADIGVRLGVDDLVGAARKRAQEWSDLRAALPEADSVLALVPDLDQPPAVDVDDWAVLARVDGRRTLAEVLAAMGASPLASGGRLVRLMGRGLVVVSVGDRDVETERADQLLDEFESRPAGAAEQGVAHDVADPAVVPEFAPEAAAEPAAGPALGTSAESFHAFEVEESTGPVHELEVQEVGAFAEFAVEEPQVAAFDEPEPAQWTVAEADPVPDVATVPAEQFGVAPDWGQLAQEAAADESAVPLRDEISPLEGVTPGYDLPTPGFEPEPVGFEAQPTTYEAAPAGAVPASMPAPVATGMQEAEPGAEPMGLAPEHHEAEAVPVALDAPVTPPELEPAAEAFAWSPWAQEMGLGESSAVAGVEPALAPASAPAHAPSQGQDYADMMAEDQTSGHTDDFPTPQSPMAATAMGGVAVTADPHEVLAGALPEPRLPGDALAAEPTAAAPLGTHALAGDAEPNAAAGAPAPVPEPGGSAPQGDLADPLAGGLLAHLMSSVRGL